ncbi:uncharacterized protein LOC134677558 [Cydia fagiglandana]|uniref:uncharacterized protein LOC134677558 n=1 Tax=Cydia fagiglandana TaxID=1458189 RepID=UPI002FEE2CAB
MSTLKCNTCNIVIDELLAYIQNKLSVSTEDTLVRICKSSFSSMEIKTSKSLLFESLPINKRKILRKGEGREQRDLEDIISVFKNTDPEFMPIFVARDLDKLPPLSYDHIDVSKLLKDLLKVQAEVADMRSRFATAEQVQEIRHELNNLRCTPAIMDSYCNVNKRRGAYLDSGPTGFTHLDVTTNSPQQPSCLHSNISARETHNDSLLQSQILSANNDCNSPCAKEGTPERRDSIDAATVELEPAMTSSYEITTKLTAGVCLPVSNSNANSECTFINNKTKLLADVVKTTVSSRGAEKSPELNPNEWKKVESRKTILQKRLIGKRGVACESNSNFKAAVMKVPILITNVHKDTAEDDIANYIRDKTHEIVRLHKIAIKKHNDYDAYKFFVPQHKLSLFLEDKLWPEGIIFRRFVNNKPREVTSIIPGSGTVPTNTLS